MVDKSLSRVENRDTPTSIIHREGCYGNSTESRVDGFIREFGPQ